MSHASARQNQTPSPVSTCRSTSTLAQNIGRPNMSSTRLILRLFKRLCQVLAALTTSSARRLRILVTCFRHFVARLKIRGFPRRNNDSPTHSPADCCTVPTSTSGVRYPPANLPLPLHNQQITSASTSSMQNVFSSSMPTLPMPLPCIPQQFIPPQTFLPSSSSSAPVTTPKLVPFAANDISRYEYRPFVYVDAVYFKDGSILSNDSTLERRLKIAIKFQHS
jgi:hypothetical protein